MKVAVVKTGPGVTWPTATASSSWASVSQCQPLDEVGPQEGEEHVAAAEEHRADLQEDEEEAAEAEGRDGRARRRGEARGAQRAGAQRGRRSPGRSEARPGDERRERAAAEDDQRARSRRAASRCEG